MALQFAYLEGFSQNSNKNLLISWLFPVNVYLKKNWVENVFWLFAHYVKYTLGYFKHYTKHYFAR